MDLLQLKYFSELAKRQHLNKTAQEMLVTPSAISSSLARLEKEMKEASKMLEFEYAALLRDQIIELRGQK